jgi:hypothetical protein
MPTVVFAAIVVAFVAVGVVLVRRTQRGAFVERLPIGDGEHVLLEEQGDFTAESPHVSETGYAAYLAKFGLANGYPTYYVSRSDLTVDGDDLRFVVPFAEGDPPAVRFSTPNAGRYEEAIVRAGRGPFASP